MTIDSGPAQVPLDYAHFVDSGNAEALLGLFTADATVILPDGRTITGRAEIARIFPVRPRDPDRPRPTNHLINNVRVGSVDAAPATAAKVDSRFQVLDRQGLQTWGRYRDDVVRVEDRWLIAVRRVIVDGHRPIPPAEG